MKRIFIILMCVVCFGCTQDINLREGKILSKKTFDDSYSEYYIGDNGDTGTITQIIVAAPDFAETGDIIGSKDGVIKVIKKAEKEK